MDLDRGSTKTVRRRPVQEVIEDEEDDADLGAYYFRTNDQPGAEVTNITNVTNNNIINKEDKAKVKQSFKAEKANNIKDIKGPRYFFSINFWIIAAIALFLFALAAAVNIARLSCSSTFSHDSM